MQPTEPVFRWDIDLREHDLDAWIKAMVQVQRKAVQAAQSTLDRWIIPSGGGSAVVIAFIAFDVFDAAPYGVLVGFLLAIAIYNVMQRRNVAYLKAVIWSEDRDPRSIVLADRTGVHHTGTVSESRAGWAHYRAVDRVGDLLVLTTQGGNEILPLAALTQPAQPTDPEVVLATLTAWIAEAAPSGATPPGWAGNA